MSRFKQLVIIAVASLSLAFIIVFPLFASQQSDSLQTHISNLVSDRSGVSFQLQIPAYTLTQAGRLQSEGLESTINQIGAPALPYYTAVVAVPAGVTTKVKVSERNISWENEAYVRPVGRPLAVTDTPNSTAEFPMYIGVDNEQMHYEPNTTIYTADALFPTAAYSVSPVQYARDVRYIEIKLYPLRYNPVSKQLKHTAIFDVEVEFVGESIGQTRPLPSINNSTAHNIAQIALNGDFVADWQGVNAAPFDTAAEVKLPVGQTAYKIAVAEDGIYAVTYADLAAVGLSGTPPLTTIEMMSNGQTVAPQIIDNNSNTLFDAGDEIRFYGWAYDGSRFEKFYVTDNVFWLWFNGTATPIGSETAVASGNVITATTASLNFDTDRVFINPNIPGLEAWANMDNDPDYFMWYRTYPSAFEGTSFDYLTVDLDISNPVTTAAGVADFTVELQSRADYRTANNPVTMSIDINNTVVTTTINARQNINTELNVPLNSLNDGLNQVDIYGGKEAVNQYSISVMLNEIRVNYLRHLKASNNHLTFRAMQTGQSQFHINGFTETDINNMIVWDVTNRTQPVNLTGFSPEGADGYKFGRELTGDNQFAIAAIGNLKSGSVSAYEVADIEPPTNGADWLAISHANFMTETERLATYRSQKGLSAHVVDFEDVQNQYGYGFPTPYAINNYLSHAFASWATAPSYLLLVGDADVNPRMIEECSCSAGSSDFDHLNPNQVPTYLTFHDRFNGFGPSDFEYSLIVGNDESPDLAVGRIAAETVAGVKSVVDKTIQYETHMLTPAEWQSHMLFVYDDSDTGGNFYNSIVFNTLPHVSDSFVDTVIGLETGDGAEVANLRDTIFDIVGAGEITSYPQKVTLLNWRGHGFVDYWGASGDGAVLKSGDALEGSGLPPSPFRNNDQPIITLSFDCLDGHFSYPGWPALSEALTQLDQGRGAAAHWSSSGLGFDSEHTKLAQGFYIGLFDLGHTAIGDAVNYAKIYALPQIHNSEIYGFILQGDPALQLYQPELEIEIDAPQSYIDMDEVVTVDLTASNSAIYPSHAVVTYSVPSDLVYVSHTAALSITHSQSSAGLNTNHIFTFDDPLDYNQSIDIQIRFRATSNGIVGLTTATIDGSGMDISPNTGRIATAMIGNSTAESKLFLPVLIIQ